MVKLLMMIAKPSFSFDAQRLHHIFGLSRWWKT